MNTTFLHNHSVMEKELEVDKDHVIVDRKDWEKAREILETLENKKEEKRTESKGVEGISRVELYLKEGWSLRFPKDNTIIYHQEGEGKIGVDSKVELEVISIDVGHAEAVLAGEGYGFLNAYGEGQIVVGIEDILMVIDTIEATLPEKEKREPVESLKN